MARAAARTLEAYLRRELRRERWPVEAMEQRGTVYRGPTDFVLREGRVYVPKDTPEHVGARKACFGNSIALSAVFGYRYVEGFAVDPGRLRVAIHHAWNLTADGFVLDSTWANTGLAYIGVEFSLGRADDATWNGDASVLDDFNRGWPVLREPWRGEDFERQWEPSEILEPVLAGDRERVREATAPRKGGRRLSTPPGGRRYPLGSREGAVPPSYGRVVERLSVEELRAELEHERGTEEYRDVVRVELSRRGDASD